MYRWHKEKHIAERNLANRIKSHSGSKPYRFVGQPGRFRKKDAWDCGQTQCYVCHSDKIDGNKTHQEIAADADFAEQLLELDE